MSFSLSLPERGALGATAGICTTFFTHPFDVVRVQMQVGEFKGTLDATVKISRAGIPTLYSGITAAWLRQVTYGSTRLGLYSYLLQRTKRQRIVAGLSNPHPPLFQKISIGFLSGGIGSLVGTPSELALVRMGADSGLPADKQRRYKHSIDCLLRVINEEGFTVLWRGVMPTVIRAAIINGVGLGVTSEAKIRFAEFTGLAPASVPNMLVATTLGSICANLTAMPFDVVKSRIQQMTHAGQYSGMLDCATKSVEREGVMVLWRGFTPALVKLMPYSIISLTLLETFTGWYTGGKSTAI